MNDDYRGIRFIILLAAIIVFIIGAALTPGKNDLENPAFMTLLGLALFALAHLAPWK